jgi:cell division protein FtsI (penicillin-binding protein 3)
MHGRVMKDHNWRRGGYGRISVPEVLMYSSNIGVSRLIDDNYKDHPEKFVDGLYREGVGIPLNIPLMGSGEPRVRRPKKDGSNWSKTALPWMSIGYETQMPPIATLTFYNAIANGGKMVRPRFVKAVRKNGARVPGGGHQRADMLSEDTERHSGNTRNGSK